VLTSTRNGYAAIRLGGSFLVGIAAFAGSLAGGATWGVAISIGSSALGLVFLLSVWVFVLRMDGKQTKQHARADDVSRPTADLLLIGASVASLVAVGYTLVDAGNRHGTEKVVLIGLAVVTVALSWTVVHTVYMLRYAGFYYGDPIGGVDFGDDNEPDYRDFAYLALTIGMTYQVSDTSLQTKAFRHIALRHALLSFVFGAVIVGVTINVVASLLHG
jgi:uncharacterized membrane protein